MQADLFVETSTISQGYDDFEIVSWRSSLDDGSYVGDRASNDNMVAGDLPTATSMAPYPWLPAGEGGRYASRSSPSLHLGNHSDTSAVVLIFRDLKIPQDAVILSATLSFAPKPSESAPIIVGSEPSLSIRAVIPGHSADVPVGWVDPSDHRSGRIQTVVTRASISTVPADAFFQRPLTGAEQLWTLDTTGYDPSGYVSTSDRIYSPNLKTVLQEVVNTPYRSGQPVQLVIDAVGGGQGGLGVSSFEGHPHRAPMLTVVAR